MPQNEPLRNESLREDAIDSFVDELIQRLSRQEISPTSTYRIQFNHRFRFQDATAIIPYLADLGITDLYASPYLQARPQSLHGYDISNHNALNPEIGSEAEHAEMIAALRSHRLGHLLDIVPNHMGLTENQWWLDVLENGQRSPYAHYFDIDWHPIKKELDGKVLLPVLGDQYGRVLEGQQLKLLFSEGAFRIDYYDHHFPVSPRTYPEILRCRLEQLDEALSDDPENLQEYYGITLALLHLPGEIQSDPKRIAEERRQIDWIKRRLEKLYRTHENIRNFIDENVALFNGKKGDPRSFDRLDQLLNIQAYRLAYWRVAADEINYRRFFDVNELASIAMERKEVFEETHRLIFRLIEERKLDGLRLDHPDGLYDPIDYFRRLQKRCLILQGRMALPEGSSDEVRSKAEATLAEAADRFLAGRTRSSAPLPFYVVVEKILSKGERLPERWPVQGTVGYEYLNAVNALFVDSRQAKRFEEIYSRFIGMRLHFPDVVYERKKFIMNTTMASEINVLSHRLNRLSEKDRLSRDFTLYSLRDAIREVIACFPIYRTYITRQEQLEEHDRKFIQVAVTKAKQRSPATDISIFDYLKRILLMQYPEYFTEADRMEQLAFVQKFQQCTGPIMAKGLEDTAFYVYNRLVSLNEVGGDPETFGISISDFHRQNAERLERWPHSMLTTSTHDTKRSEDIRARINVLSEIPDEWEAAVTRWAELNHSKKSEVEGEPAPDPNEEYLLYQTLIGAWPPEYPSPSEHDAFKKRIQAYMTKASKEAKVNTSWISPNEAYDQALASFTEAILDTAQRNPFLEEFRKLQKKVAHFGVFNSLSQLLLKIASPGVPDFYQGCELFDFSLVDPDNRRPVDYPFRAQLLSALMKEIPSGGPSPSFIQALLGEKGDRLKLYVAWRALQCRRANRALFLTGVYLPHETIGPARDRLLAFSRRSKEGRIVAAAPRLLVSLLEHRLIDPIGAVWEGSGILIEDEIPGSRYRNELTGEVVEVQREDGKTVLPLSDVFSGFPLGLLVRQG